MAKDADEPEVARAWAQLPDYQNVPLKKSASFVQLYLTHYARDEHLAARLEKRAEECAALAAVYPEVVKFFESTRGRIARHYWCKHVVAACVLTYLDFDNECRAQVFAECNWEAGDEDFVRPLRQLDAIRNSTDFLPPGRERDQCREEIFEAYSELLSALDVHHQSPDHDSRRELAEVSARIEQARRLVKTTGQRHAQTQYLAGMSAAIVAIVAMAAVAAVALFVFGFGGLAPLLVTWAIFGSVGAFVSVIARIAQRDFSPTWEASRWELRRGGMSRAIVGAVFGMAIPLLVIGGLAAVTPDIKPDESLRSQAFFIALALAAGFSERWAQDLLEKQPAVLSSKDETSKNGAGGSGASRT